MPAWLTAFCKLVGLADFAAKWAKQDHDEGNGAAREVATVNAERVEAQIDQQETRDDVRRLSHSELVDGLRPYAAHRD